jgi:hypothetical protein
VAGIAATLALYIAWEVDAIRGMNRGNGVTLFDGLLRRIRGFTPRSWSELRETVRALKDLAETVRTLRELAVLILTLLVLTGCVPGCVSQLVPDSAPSSPPPARIQRL